MADTKERVKAPDIETVTESATCVDLVFFFSRFGLHFVTGSFQFITANFFLSFSL